MKKYRFFFHYNKKEDKMSVHFKKKCYITDHVFCKMSVESKRNKVQPRVVMQGWASDIEVHPNKIILK